MTTTTTPAAPTCCGHPVKYGSAADTAYPTGMRHAYWCETCKRKGVAGTEADARKEFEKTQRVGKGAAEKKPANTPSTPSTPPAGTDVMLIPRNPADLPTWSEQHMRDLMYAVSAVITEAPAVVRLIKNNCRYLMQSAHIKKCWESEEGIGSLLRANEEALEMGAELGKMGSIVPFGKVGVFVPSVEGCKFALTNGGNAPFEWLNIEPIHANDIRDIGRKSGNFYADIKPGYPRGDVIQIAVYGKHAKSGFIVGEVYDASRLLDKMEVHSPSYKHYLQDMRAFEIARSEGKIKSLNGREYIEKIINTGNDKYADQDRAAFDAAEKAGTLKKDGKGEYVESVIPKKDGTTWTKKIYRSQIENPGTETERVFLDELSNPYDGADRPEMLMKAAGKTFMTKYVRVRNAEAAMGELRRVDPDNIDAVIDASLDAALANMQTVSGEFEVVPEEGGDEKGPETPASTQALKTKLEKASSAPHTPQNPPPRKAGGKIGEDELF